MERQLHLPVRGLPGPRRPELQVQQLWVSLRPAVSYFALLTLALLPFTRRVGYNEESTFSVCSNDDCGDDDCEVQQK
jgi:hypothetical protein